MILEILGFLKKSLLRKISLAIFAIAPLKKQAMIYGTLLSVYIFFSTIYWARVK